MNLRRKGLVSLVGTVVITASLLGWSQLAGNKPFLGLDLQGGVAVVLVPSGEATDAQLDDAVAIIRSRVDAIGVAEPEITRQGQNISVEIPGVENRQQAIELVGQTGELTFRPVLAEYPTGFEVDENGQPVLPEPEVEVTPEPTEGDGTPTGEDTPTTEVPAESVPTTAVDEGAIGRSGFVPGESAAGLQDPAPEAPSDSVPADSTTLPPEITQQIQGLGDQINPAASLGAPELTTDNGLDQEIVLPEYRNIDGKRFEVARYRLGPASLTGSGLEGASAALDERGQWVVRPVFKAGSEGIDAFNTTTSACYAKSATCPTGKLAITLDAEVISALGVQAASFGRDQIVISGGFDEPAAKDLGTVLRYGALPVKLGIESVQEVSASLGRDALQAGLIAGVVGLLLVALFMLGFYRLIGLTAVAKLLLELALLWVVISWLGTTQGLALTLAGVAAIVVSFGISVDSNVVFFETVKEAVRGGRTPRSAAEKGFISAWGTIVKADFASLIAAVLLYVLAVGPVRGFAFNLGLATALDLIVSWFFMRPSGVLSLQSKWCAAHPRWFAMPMTEGATAVSERRASRRARPADETPESTPAPGAVMVAEVVDAQSDASSDEVSDVIADEVAPDATEVAVDAGDDGEDD